MTISTSYDRPTTATLAVNLSNGEAWDAGPEDLVKFGLVNSQKAYGARLIPFEKAVGEAGEEADQDYRELKETDVYRAVMTMVHSALFPDNYVNGRNQEVVTESMQFLARLAVKELEANQSMADSH